MLYNRGIYNSLLIAEAIHNAQKLTGKKVDRPAKTCGGASRQSSFTEARLKELGFDGFAPPLRSTCEDHNGHGPLSPSRDSGTARDT